MSQLDTKDVGDVQKSTQPADDSDLTKVDWFTTITSTIALVIGIAWFIQMIIEGFFNK